MQFPGYGVIFKISCEYTARTFQITETGWVFNFSLKWLFALFRSFVRVNGQLNIFPLSSVAIIKCRDAIYCVSIDICVRLTYGITIIHAIYHT